MRGSSQPPGIAVRLRSRAADVLAKPDTIIRNAQTLCAAQIFVDSILNRAGCGLGRFRNWKAPVRYINVAPSHLPSFLLPCPHCGHRMMITAVAPALYPNGAASNDLEDVTHTCVQCGTTCPTHWRRYVATRLDAVQKVQEIGFQVCRIVVRRHTVDARMIGN
jgi:hypothetical protein